MDNHVHIVIPGVYKALEKSNGCIQLGQPSTNKLWAAAPDEDCLYLNVWVPHPPREKRPVMVSSTYVWVPSEQMIVIHIL